MRFDISRYQELVVISLFLSLGCMSCDQRNDEYSEAANLEFAFDSDQDGAMNIYIASGDLDWSPDGAQLLFVSRRMEGREQLYVAEVPS